MVAALLCLGRRAKRKAARADVAAQTPTLRGSPRCPYRGVLLHRAADVNPLFGGIKKLSDGRGRWRTIRTLLIRRRDGYVSWLMERCVLRGARAMARLCRRSCRCTGSN